MSKLQTHINSGGMAFAMVFSGQFSTRNDKNSGAFANPPLPRESFRVVSK